MHSSYRDILDAAKGQSPKWWDNNGVPRFCDPKPAESNIYADWFICAEIHCQSCGRRFTVGADFTLYDFAYQHLLAETKEDFARPTLHEIATSFHYGDPPAHGCIGDTMNSVPWRIISAQAKSNQSYNWVVDDALTDLDIVPDWFKNDNRT